MFASDFPVNDSVFIQRLGILRLLIFGDPVVKKKHSGL
jgi:hypothetical protein